MMANLTFLERVLHLEPDREDDVVARLREARKVGRVVARRLRLLDLDIRAELLLRLLQPLVGHRVERAVVYAADVGYQARLDLPAATRRRRAGGGGRGGGRAARRRGSGIAAAAARAAGERQASGNERGQRKRAREKASSGSRKGHVIGTPGSRILRPSVATYGTG